MVCFFEIMIQVHADKLLKRALDKFFIGETNSSTWHFTTQTWQGFINQTIPKPSKGCKLEIKIELCWQIGEHVKWDDNDSEFLTTTNNAVRLKKFKFVLWHLCNCANIIFEFTNLCITTYLWIRIKPILHIGSVTLHRQLFSNEKQGATMCFSCLA